MTSIFEITNHIMPYDKWEFRNICKQYIFKQDNIENYKSCVEIHEIIYRYSYEISGVTFVITLLILLQVFHTYYVYMKDLS